jgi:hypothetical protein
MTSRNPQPLSHVFPSLRTRQIQGMTSPTMASPFSPLLSPVNEQATMLFDYPLCLEQLLVTHPPMDLSDEVEIIDYRNPAKGGLADVYAGTNSETKVCSVRVYYSFLCSISSGCCQSIQNKQGPGCSCGSVQQAGESYLHSYA